MKKSAGVPVTPAVHALISEGNRHREGRSWEQASTAYRAALAADPGLIHIWVQLGHMLKEYRANLEACEAYLEALRIDPQDPALMGWLYGIAGRLPSERRRTLMHEIYHIRGVQPRPHMIQQDAPTSCGDNDVVFDVSDLVAYFGRARRPTGIQRVQIEIINAALELGVRHGVRICCSVEEASQWVELSAALFQHVTRLAVGHSDIDDAEWRDAIADINAAILFGSDFVFRKGAHVINLGTSWWLRNYFLQVRNGQFDHGIEYVPFVHDLIPVLAPQHCVQGLVEDFNSWIVGVFDHADRFLVNSQATKSDLLRVAGMLDKDVEPDAITVVPLDGAFEPKTAPHASPVLKSCGLDRKDFVLFVSTIESRKGHIVALQAWQRLLDAHGSATPYLVCVGNNGWLNQDFYDALNRDTSLKERVILLSGIADTDLAYLYGACLFTIYPSTYEGWGLPVTESLAFGKAVVVADNSSLPEAGAEFAVYVQTGNDRDLAEKVAILAFDESERARWEEAIRAKFRPRPWSAIAQQIVDAVAASHPEAIRDAAPCLSPGRWYDLSRVSSIHVHAGAGVAERLRVGDGWESPDDLGCWTKEREARMRFHVPAVQPGRIALKFYCRGETQWTVRMDGEVIGEGVVKEGEYKIGICDLSPSERTVVISIAHSSISSQERHMESNLGVSGIMLLHANQGVNDIID